MKHEKWIRNIHLLRDGELSPEEEQTLSTHLSQCKHCSAMYELVQLDWIKVMGETASEPVLTHSERLSDGILSTIRSNELQTSRSRKTTQLKKEPFFLMPGFRLGLQVTSLVLLAIFFIEQFQVTHSVQRLELQLQSQNIQPRHARLHMVPPLFKKKLGRIVKGQAEKLGLPSKKIETMLNSMESGSFDNEILTTRKQALAPLGKWLSDQWGIAKFKDMKRYWRQR